jgi:hypothetical protein
MADLNPNELENESSIIDVTNTESDVAVNPTTTIHLDNDDKEFAANSDVVEDRGGDDDGGSDDDDDNDDDDDDDDDDGISEGREESDGGDDDNNKRGDNEDIEDNSNNVENSIGDNELATADNDKTYSPLKDISAKYKEGPFKENSKFKAYQKMDIGGAEGLYYFGAKVLMENEEDSIIEGSLIEYADMFEGGFFFLACAYSTYLDDLQFIFVKQSWYEKCPGSDEYEGNFSNVRGYYK